jgi:ATP-binding cassette subfamily B (MDR/TAP) protein 1
MIRVLKLNKPELVYILIGLLGCIVNGCINPAFSVLFGKITVVFTICDPEQQKKEIIFYVIAFVGIGVIVFLSYFTWV